jgi:autotransporter-associated beta strand protein
VTDNNTTKFGGDLSWKGIEITNPGGAVIIEGPNTLTLGAAGIDAATAEKSLSLKAPLILGADQLWRFNGKTLFHNFGDTNTTITNGGHTLTIENGTVQISGNLTGAGSLTRSGDNSQTIIRGICSYTGGTTIESGVFTIGTGTIGGDGEISPSSLVSGSSRGTLRFWRTDDFSFPNTITGDIKVEKRGPGIVTLTGRNDFSGTATVLEGELVNKESASTPTGSGKTP